MEHSIIKIDTSEDGGDYVVDWRYLHNGFVTECGYSIVINDGNISTMQEHNLLQMGELQGESIDNEAPEITQVVIDAAMLLARDKIEQKHPNSTIIEQQGEKYYNIVEKTYYYRVRTVYQILTGEFGAEYLDYSL